MTQRANRAQRAAVGGKITPLTGTTLQPTPGQTSMLQVLRATYGGAVGRMSAVDPATRHVTITMTTFHGHSQWVIDSNGVVVARHEPLSLFQEGNNATEP